MNKRIQDLARQYLMHERFSRYGESTEEDYYDFLPEELEEFVQSIVKECIQVIDDSTPVYSLEDQQDAYCQGTDNGYQSALLEIKEHFGVGK